MSRSTWQRQLFVTWSLASILAGSALAAPELDVALPRYRLKLGQELTYRDTSEHKYGNDADSKAIERVADYQLWVVRANDNGSWRIVVRSSETYTYGGKKSPLPASSTLAHFDLFADGRLVRSESLGYRLDPASLFPRLPANAGEAKQGWQDYEPGEGTQSRLKFDAAKSSSGTWVFDLDRETPSDPVYLSTYRAQFSFDLERGLIAHARSESTQGYGGGRGTGTLDLVTSGVSDAAWLLKFAAETDRCFAANKIYDELCLRAGKERQESESLLAKAEATLKDVRNRLTLPVLTQQLEEQLKSHEASAKWILDDARRFAAIIGKPAADWQATDLDGKQHALEDYRGKVVVLDFWYRGCGWCIKAMPQVNQLAADFRGEPVAVLGMCTDENEQDARLVADKMQLSYPVLKASGLPQKYQVTGFPTLVIVDQQGTLHEVEFGYSPNLRDDVAKTIRALLKKRQAP